MGLRSIAAAAFAVLLAAPAWGEETPYVAYVNAPDVYVRSGPGRDYYPTDKLQKGERVEIYRHDPGGWYAIRPPRQSFSWVSARQLEPLGDGLAIAKGPRVVCRVGSALSDTRDVIQVRLEKDEKVEVLKQPTGESPWFKIAPPAGEFRWVFSKFVDREPPNDDPQADSRASDTSGFRPKSRDGSVRLASGASDENADDQTPAAATRRSANNIASPDGLARELTDIDFNLSIIVADDISTWSFDELQRRADEALKLARDSAERGRARVLISKLNRFQDIKERHDRLRRDGALVDGSSNVQASATIARRADDPRFDGVGRLSPVISQKTGGPQYALVDANNAVISFVTPAPGVNLRSYVDKQVGVNGQRGYMTDLQRQHISVQRVTLLDTQRR